MKATTITIDYREYDDNEIPDRFTMPVIGIHETLRVEFVDAQYVVTSTKPDASPNWVGRDKNRHAAILEYLKTRLGLYKDETHQEAL